MKEARVIVVGGGAAGIAAATRLVQNGFQNVTLLEAEDRLGGRCKTVALGDEHVDLGAQWIHGETQNVVHKMAAQANLTKDSVFGEKRFEFILSDGKLMSSDVSEALYEYCNRILDHIAEQTLPPSALSLGEADTKTCNNNTKNLKDNNTSNQEALEKGDFTSRRMSNEIKKKFDENLKDLNEFSIANLETHKDDKLPCNSALSLGEVFVKEFKENLKELNEFNISDQDIRLFLEWYGKFQDSYDASDSWFDVSFEGRLKFKLCGGNQHVTWKTGGFSNIIDLLLQKIPKTNSEIPLNALLGKKVTQITRNHDVVVKCADGSIFPADHVIVCVSLGVLKYAPSMFSPPLPPHKILAIDTLALGVAEKLFLQFPHRWWPQDSALLNVLLDVHAKEELERVGKKWLVGVVAFFVLDNAPNTLCAWAGASSARYISEMPDDVIKDDLHYFLKRYFSNVYTIPAPVRFVRSNWFGNPHFRGAYSFVTVRANVAGSTSDDLADPILDETGKPVLMFAGEATHPHFFSTVHGAVETGWREADRLISYFK